MTLYPFQHVGVDWLVSRERGGILADDMGLGKTIQALHAAHALGAQRVLVVCPNSCRSVWAQELDRWFPHTDYIVLDAPSMPSDMREVAVIERTSRFVILNYQMMRALQTVIAKQKWDVVIFDEAHALSNRKSLTHKVSRFITRLATAKRVWYLTGTPVQNHVEEYWPLLRTFAPEFGSYWRYVYAYCNVDPIIHPRYKRAHEAGLPIPREAIIGQEVANITDEADPRIKRLVDRIAPYILRRTKLQVYDQLPEKTVTRVPLTLDKTTRKLYTAMNQRMRCVLPTGQDVTADTTLAQQTRLLQLCVDWRLLIGDDAHDEILTGPKADALLEHIAALGGRPFVVFSQWSRVVSMVHNLLADKGISAAEFTGRNLTTREDQLSWWNTGRAQALLVTLDAGGTGRDFTRAGTAFFLDRSFNPKANLQAEDRLWRHGQAHPVNIYDFYCTNTIEEHVLNVDDLKTHVADITVEVLADA